MAIHLDGSVVQRLIETALEGANDSTAPVTLRVIHTGEPDPDPSESTVWARVMSLKLAREARRSTDEEPAASVELVVAVTCPEATSAESAYAIASAVEHVSRVLECATLDDIATSGHVVHLYNTESEDEQGGEFHQILAAVVRCFGIARRTSGTSMADFH